MKRSLSGSFAVVCLAAVGCASFEPAPEVPVNPAERWPEHHALAAAQPNKPTKRVRSVATSDASIGADGLDADTRSAIAPRVAEKAVAQRENDIAYKVGGKQVGFQVDARADWEHARHAAYPLREFASSLMMVNVKSGTTIALLHVESTHGTIAQVAKLMADRFPGSVIPALAPDAAEAVFDFAGTGKDGRAQPGTVLLRKLEGIDTDYAVIVAVNAVGTDPAAPGASHAVIAKVAETLVVEQ